MERLEICWKKFKDTRLIKALAWRRNGCWGGDGTGKGKTKNKKVIFAFGA